MSSLQTSPLKLIDLGDLALAYLHPQIVPSATTRRVTWQVLVAKEFSVVVATSLVIMLSLVVS